MSEDLTREEKINNSYRYYCIEFVKLIQEFEHKKNPYWWDNAYSQGRKDMLEDIIDVLESIKQ